MQLGQGKTIIDDTAKGGLTYNNLGTFNHDCLRFQTFKTLISTLFEAIWVSN